MISVANRAEFKDLGEDQVYDRVRASVWSEEKSKEAREWLSLERSKIARSANRAAWIAAIAAIIAAVCAIISVLSLHGPSLPH